jgi:transposase
VLRVAAVGWLYHDIPFYTEDTWRNFYTQQHKHYCGIALHAKAMYVCILDESGAKLVHKNLPTTPEAFLQIIAPYREDVVVGVECMLTWYWVADLCSKEGIAFVVGHALYMQAIHGGKAKNDKVDAHKLAVLLRGGRFPQAYVYPAEMRATRDLLRRRCHLVRKRAELLAHIHNTNSQYNLPEIGKKLVYKANREGVEEHFPDPSVRKTIEMDLSLIDHYDKLLSEVELYITRSAKTQDVQTFARLQSVPGVGQILALVILYEIQDITRFPRVQDFVSYCRLVKCAKGLCRSSGPLLTAESAEQGIFYETRTQTRQSQSADRIGTQARTYRVLHAHARTSV